MTFVGFEHSIANMYFIPLGIFLGAEVTRGSVFNEQPTAGNHRNIIGGAFFVGFMYSVAYVRKAKKVLIILKEAENRPGIISRPETGE